jgi:hypothetical protein
LGKLNSFLFKFNSDENTRNNIEYAIQRFGEIPAVKYWMSLEKKYQEEQKGNDTMGIKSFKSWLVEQEDPMARNIATTTTEQRTPRTKTQRKRKTRTTRKPEEVAEENPGITISFNDDGDAVCSMKNISFDNLKSLDGLLE